MKLIYEGVQNNEQECLDRVAFEIGKSEDNVITITLRRIPADDRVPEHWAVRATAGEGNIEEDPPCPAEDDGLVTFEVSGVYEGNPPVPCPYTEFPYVQLPGAWGVPYGCWPLTAPPPVYEHVTYGYNTVTGKVGPL